MLILRFRAQLAPHLPADPQEKNAPREQKPEDLKQLRCNSGAYNPKNGRSKNADKNSALPLLVWEAGRGEAYDDGIISGQH
jgi:hypothetical protein